MQKFTVKIGCIGVWSTPYKCLCIEMWFGLLMNTIPPRMRLYGGDWLGYSHHKYRCGKACQLWTFLFYVLPWNGPCIAKFWLFRDHANNFYTLGFLLTSCFEKSAFNLWIFGVPHSTFYPVSNVPVNSRNLMETVNVLTSYVTAKQQQVMYNTSRTDMTAANNTRENISNYLQTNVINNMQHTVNMARL